MTDELDTSLWWLGTLLRNLGRGLPGGLAWWSPRVLGTPGASEHVEQEQLQHGYAPSACDDRSHKPPSITNVTPVMNADASEQR